MQERETEAFYVNEIPQDDISPELRLVLRRRSKKARIQFIIDALAEEGYSDISEIEAKMLVNTRCPK